MSFNIKATFKKVCSKTVEISKSAFSFTAEKFKKIYAAAVSFVKSIKDKITATSFFVKVLELVKSHKKAVFATSVSLASALILFVGFAMAGVTVGFKVEYNGKVIATVKSDEISNNAMLIARKNLSGDVKEFLRTPKLSLTITLKDKLNNADQLADSMLTNTDEIVNTCALIVNGEYKAYCDEATLLNILEERKTAFYNEKFENQAEFTDEVKTLNGYFKKEDVKKGEDVEAVVSALNVKTTYTKVTDIKIKYTTKYVKDPLLKKGYNKVTTSGKNGLSQKTELVETLNGEELKTTLVSEVILTEPVTKVITVGAATTTLSEKDKANISKAGFICPLAKGTYRISSYWGDGRNHKGIDLCANYGVTIYAAGAGTVVHAGWEGDYGYSVIIDHGNGIKTRYAHSSKLYVKKGTKVEQGEAIAAIGSTGYSTGNHVHFEVMINGTRVNPAPYIGL